MKCFTRIFEISKISSWPQLHCVAQDFDLQLRALICSQKLWYIVLWHSQIYADTLGSTHQHFQLMAKEGHSLCGQSHELFHMVLVESPVLKIDSINSSFFRLFLTFDFKGCGLAFKQLAGI